MAEDDIHDDHSFRLGMIVGQMQAITDMWPFSPKATRQAMTCPAS